MTQTLTYFLFLATFLLGAYALHRRLAGRRAWMLLLTAYRRRSAGRLEEAVRLLESATRLAPRLAEAHAELAVTRLALGRDPAAVRAGFEIALKLDPRQVAARYGLGFVLLHRFAEAEPAIVQLKAALALDPDYFAAWNTYGLALLARGDRAGAEAAFTRAHFLDPDAPEAENNLGVVRAREGRASEAVVHLRHALEGGEDLSTRANLERVQGAARKASDPA